MDSLQSFSKIDAHIHFNADRDELLDFASEYNFSLLSINTEVPEFPPVAAQQKLAKSHQKSTNTELYYATTIPTENIFQDDWTEYAIRKIENDISEGACGVKFWKNIGMSIQRPNGSFLMLDEPKFESIFTFLENKKIPVLGHQGEPKNCWLPVDEMTVKSDRDYFSHHPEYHMYQHDEYPDYWEHIKARDHILERHPNLRFVGLHLASLEWNLDEVSNRLENYSRFAVDLAERFSHLYYHAAKDRNKVKKFFEKYQDRIIYGTDIIDDPKQSAADIIHELKKRWEKHWLFLSTDKKLISDQIDQPFSGLKLSESVLKKIYRSNAQNWYLL